MGSSDTERGPPVPSDQDTSTRRYGPCFREGPPGPATGSTAQDGEGALPLSSTQTGPSLQWVSDPSAGLGQPIPPDST